MSYDVVVVDPPLPASDAEAWDQLDSLIAQEGTVPPRFRTLHDLLVAQYPCLSTLSDDEIDDGVWSDGPLWNNFGARAACLGISYSRVEEVLPFLISTARSLDFAVFDSQTALIHRPNGFQGYILTLENQPPLERPTLEQLHAAVDSLTPDGGPGFLILDGLNASYAQAAGGDGAYTVEWRETFGETFRHWVAGIAGRPSERDITIEGNGFQVTVKENESLGIADVKTILRAFLQGKARLANYSWRDVTERFV